MSESNLARPWLVAVVRSGKTRYELRAYPRGGSPYVDDQPATGPEQKLLASRVTGRGIAPKWMTRLEQAVDEKGGFLDFDDLVDFARGFMPAKGIGGDRSKA